MKAVDLRTLRPAQNMRWQWDCQGSGACSRSATEHENDQRIPSREGNGRLALGWSCKWRQTHPALGL
jgi:hypothetical protein